MCLGRLLGFRTARVASPQTPCYRVAMKSKVTKHDSGLDISVEQVGDSQRALLDAFQECQEGRCSCKTAEYEKLASIDVQAGNDAIRIRLKPRSGATINQAAVEDCLEYPLDKATKG